MRVYELSKELGVVNKELIEAAKSLGISLKSHASSIRDDEAVKIREILGKSKNIDTGKGDPQTEEAHAKEKVKVIKSDSGQEVVEKRKGSKVILRRRKKVDEEVKPEVAEDADQVQEAVSESVGQAAFAEPKEAETRDKIKPEHAEQALEAKEQLSTEQQESLQSDAELKEDEQGKVQAEKDAADADKQKKEAKAPDKAPDSEAGKDLKKAKKKGKAVKPTREEIIDEDSLEELKKAFRTKLPVRKKEYLVENRRPKAKFTDSSKFAKSHDRHTGSAQSASASTDQASSDAQVIPITAKPAKKVIKIPESINVAELAKKMGVKSGAVLRKLLSLGVTSSITQSIDHETATILAQEFGYEVVVDVFEEDNHLVEQAADEKENLVTRYPVVTVMGHVDHGKTTLLDTIRKTKVVEGEAGGITQHIGAYSVPVQDKKVTFIDTPGHEAFTAMRARGAQVTDVVILVVAADDGVMPQTVEAVNHAKAAEVPVIVAVNKIDKPEAEPDRVKRELSEIGLVPEDWGGDALFTDVSAKTGQGIDELLDLILLQADVLELKANPDKRANGIVVESKLDKGRGPIATVIVKEGTLKIGDSLISGTDYGKVRALINDSGKNMKEAGPSTPAEVMGFSSVPTAGVPFYVVSDEKTLKEIVSHRESKQLGSVAAPERKLSLENLFENLEQGETKELPIIIKADTQGSVGALIDSIQKLSSDKCTVKIVHSAVGAINESDIVLAGASNAIVLGFNVRPDPKALQISEKQGVSIEIHSIIYDAIDRIKSSMEGLLEPIKKENITGHAEVRDTFHVSKIGTIAGCYVTDGKFTRNSNVRLIRDGIVVYDGELESLRRFKDDVKEVQNGYECGISIRNFNDIKVGDILENYIIEEERQKL
ncbi:MAG: translation initiation factor IF-2 [Candidatus Dadabacteria bacterium]|nr:translation initiation factor IF-2 [Candidatus Dadabacteria bacterium]NIS09751.1 translation initiation factor IF-2 [Candidatus Dadabacteria bacterium]NIV41116.1 translation initiation factor IF-2 [Candidatus Dadabacteria bacterium]NIX16209.1 translation initiation factor IF-2 [Candidatus Dadabacteria bacterium]NIY22832.1 translation initiation factor IF-2 [Candidatus Dadabacteria bacterium]